MAQQGEGNYQSGYVKGVRSTSDNQSKNRVIQVDGKKPLRINANEAPTSILIEKAGGGIFETKQAEYNHMEDDVLPKHVTASGAHNDSTTTLAVAANQGKRVVVGQTLKVLRTDEFLLVTAISADSLTVTRGVEQSTPSAINDLEEIQLLGTAFDEVSDAPESITSEAAFVVNTCQLFRNTIELSQRDINGEHYSGPEWERKWDDCNLSHHQDIDKAFMFNNVQSAKYTGGLDFWLTTHVTNNSGNPLTEATWLDLLIKVFRLNNAELTCLSGENVLRAVNDWVRDGLRYTPEARMAGVNIAKYQSYWGTVNMVRHGLMCPRGTEVTAANKGWSGMAYLLQLKNIKIAKYAGGRWKKIDHNIQTPGRDSRKSGMLTDAGLMLKNEKSHGKLLCVG